MNDSGESASVVLLPEDDPAPYLVSQVEYRLLSGPQSEWKNSVSFAHYSATWSFFLGLPLFFFSFMYLAGGLV
jgi:hypothetical protein